eukprot:gene7549-biopygen6006
MRPPGSLWSVRDSAGAAAGVRRVSSSSNSRSA